MVQVHTLNDFNRESQSQLYSGNRTLSYSPDQQSFMDIFMPHFNMKTFTFISTMALIIIHIIFTICYLVNKKTEGFKSLLLNQGLYVSRGQVWRLITSCLIHADFFHIFFNSLCLAKLGFIIEHYYGTKIFALIWIFIGVLDSLIYGALKPLVFSLGASGIAFGLIGMQLGYIWYTWNYNQNKIETVISLVVLFMLNLMIMFSDKAISAYPHIIGFIIGLLIFLAWPKIGNFAMPR